MPAFLHAAPRLHPRGKPYGTLIVGNLVQRISVHKDAVVAGFTKHYGMHRVVYERSE